MTFSFAHLIGSGPKADQSDAKGEDEKDDDADTSTSEDQENGGTEGSAGGADDKAGTDDDKAGSEDETAEAAHARGLAEGRHAERQRCGAIFEAAGPGTVALAAGIAFNTDLSAEQAKAMFKAAPKAGGGLGQLMAGQNPKAPTGGGGTDTAGGDKTASRILANAGRGRTKPEG